MFEQHNSYWQHRVRICYRFVLFSNGLVSFYSFCAFFFPFHQSFLCKWQSQRHPLSERPADRLTRTRKKGGNNEWRDAFILMKGINAKAFILSIIPLKSPLHSCPPPPPSLPPATPGPCILASLLASEGLTNPFKGNHRKQYLDPKKTMAVPFSSVFVI